MKKLSIFAAVLVLTLTAFTGCRRRNEGTVPSTAETLMPTVATTEATTEAATESTTGMTTMPQATDTVPDGMDPDNNTTGTDATMEGRSRGGMGGMGNMGGTGR